MRKKGYTLFTMLLVVALVFSSWPGHVQAADGTLGISSTNGQNVAGQKTNLTITYAPGIQLNLAGSTVFTLPAGLTATVADKFNGTSLPANAISSDGRTITLNASLVGLNLLASNTLVLNNKTLPAAGNYSFGASVKNLLNVTIGEATQQGTFTVIGAVPPPTAAQISVSNAISGNSTINITGQNPGDTITIYNDKNEVLGTGTVNASGQATVSAALVPAGGTIQVSALRGTAESAKTSFIYTAAVLSPIPAANISVSNSYGNQDTVAVTGLTAGDLVTVYSNGSAIGTGTADSNGSVTVAVTLTPEGGNLNMTRKRSGVESAATPVSYPAQIIPPVASGNVTVTNSYGGTSQVTVKNLSIGDIVTVSANGTVLATAPAVTNTLTLPVLLEPVGGSLNISVKQGILQSATTTVNYPSIVVPAILSSNIQVKNLSGNADVVAAVNLTAGDTVTVYDGTGVLGIGTVDAQGKVSIPVQLLPVGGSVNVSVNHAGVESLATPVVYVAEIVPAILSNQISLSPILNGTTNVSINGLNNGDVVKVYGNGTVLGTATANASGTVSIPVSVNAQGGSLSVELLRNGLASAATSITYGAVVVPPVSAGNITVSNTSGNNDTVTVTGQTQGNLITVYGNGKVLGTATVGSNGQAVINAALVPVGGVIGVSVTSQGVESIVTPVLYPAEMVPALAVASVNIDNNTGSQDIVQISSLKQGDVVKVYGSADLLGSAELQADGTLEVPVTLLPIGGSLSVALVRNGVESVPTLVSYSTEVVNPLLPAAIKVENLINATSKVTVNGLQNGDIIHVYAHGELLGTGTADSNGVAAVNTDLAPNGGVVGVSLVRNTVESPTAQINYGSIVVPAVDASQVQPQNNYGNQDIVTVTDLKEDQAITVYQDNEVLGTGKADASGKVVIGLTLIPAGGAVQVSTTYLGIESNPVSVAYGAEIVPPIPASDITILNNEGNMDNVNIRNLVAGDLVTIYQSNNVISTKKADTNGDITAGLTLQPYGGTLSFTREHSGLASVSTDVIYAAEPGPVLSASSISINNLTGNEDTIQVTGLQQGDMIRVYDANGTLLGSDIAGSFSWVMLQVQLLPGGGEVSVQLTRNQMDSNIVKVTYVAEEVPPANAPVADIVVDSQQRDQAVITVTGMNAGDIAKVYDDDDQLLGSAPADGSGKAAVSFKFLKAQGRLFAKVASGGVETTVRSFDYQGIVFPTTDPTAELTTIDGNQGTVTATNIVAGDIVKVYDIDSNLLGTQTADGNGQAVVNFIFPTTDGELTVTVTGSEPETEIATLPYSGIVLPVAPTPTADLSDVDGDQGTVTATNIASGDTVKVYDADGNLLGTQVAGSSGEVVVNFTFPTASGELTVTVTSNGTEKEITTLPYSGVDLPATPTPTATLSDIDGNQGTVTATNIASGDTVKVYDADGNLLGTQVAGSSGEVVVNFTFPTANGELTVTVTSNGTEKEITTLPYSGVDLPATPTPTATLSDIDGNQGTVTATNIVAGDIVKVYDIDSNLLGTQTAGSNGQAVVNFIFPTTDGELTVTVTSNGTEKEITTLPYSGVDLPATPTPTADLSDIDGNQGTVTATNIASGDTVKVYDADGNLLGTQVAGSSGEVEVNFTLPTAS
uniref:BslA/BslB family hydrophobin n=1 Tax=Paenibacillus sp. A9 TaxID=1284352 RepID=UPI00056335E2